jgi:hypothetical protein
VEDNQVFLARVEADSVCPPPLMHMTTALNQFTHAISKGRKAIEQLKNNQIVGKHCLLAP